MEDELWKMVPLVGDDLHIRKVLNMIDITGALKFDRENAS